MDIQTIKSKYPNWKPVLADLTFYYLDPDLVLSDIQIFRRIRIRYRIISLNLIDGNSLLLNVKSVMFTL